MASAPLYYFQWIAKDLDLVLETKEQLEEVRTSVRKLKMNDEMPKIPNNPHSVKLELYKDRAFVGNLRLTIANTYNNSEEYGITNAYSDEYAQIKDLE